MAGLPAPAGDERQTLVNFIAFQQDAFAAVAHGLTDEQARSTPSVSALSVGALIKHVTAVQAGWVARAEAAPDFPPRDTRPMAEQMAEHQDQLTMRDDEKLGDLLDALRTQNAKTLQAFAELDLDALVPVPHEVPWFPSDVDHWSVRWVGMHIIEELSRHAGHADIIRESIDRATMYELLAAEEEWPETEFIKRWRPAAQ
ncbi:DinB family protein [Mycolicibacterium mucogenicum]|mgnify:CR=1 FL=1|uniref:DinB family protein n=1 Tax=Mycolicibacterium mucogenicum TaxID=56689 RepID=A0A4R5WQ80_MYCMU|nr:DinB family protein [Mycolicibacterium mucogenicum]MCX8554655.1 DinB family protein [Mycolicibacterium mucogenicum]TDK93679.1 DinB family protein [Mycolicibacterium mucogenicum]